MDSFTPPNQEQFLRIMREREERLQREAEERAHARGLSVQLSERTLRVGGIVQEQDYVRPGIIERDRESITWCIPFWPISRQPEALLRDFLLLADGTNDDVVNFIENWGVLGFTARKVKGAGDSAETDDSYAPRREELGSYTAFARYAYRLLKIAASLQEGKLGSLDDWREVLSLNEAIPDKGRRMSAANLELQRFDPDFHKRLSDLKWQHFERDLYPSQDNQWKSIGYEFSDWIGIKTYLYVEPEGLFDLQVAQLTERMRSRFLETDEEEDLHAHWTPWWARMTILVPLALQLLNAIARPIPKCGYCGKVFPASRKQRGGKRIDGRDEMPLCSDICRRARHNDRQRLAARRRRDAERKGSES